jgi:hypothetical protein
VNLLRFGYYVLLATFAPKYLQAQHDREYARDLAAAQNVRDSMWLLGCEPTNFIELRDSEVCTVCRRETWVWSAGDKQCPLCLRKWIRDSFKVSSKKRTV